MPSDAVDMLVVHRVFRREFHDMPRLISAVLTRDTTRAKIVADHVTFMVAALHHHHAAEDDMVWLKLRSRAPAHQADVERMERSTRRSQPSSTMSGHFCRRGRNQPKQH